MDTCIWTEDECGCYEVQCNKGCFEFTHGGVKENKFSFCPYCGKPLVDVKYCESEEDDI